MTVSWWENEEFPKISPRIWKLPATAGGPPVVTFCRSVLWVVCHDRDSGLPRLSGWILSGGRGARWARWAGGCRRSGTYVSYRPHTPVHYTIVFYFHFTFHIILWCQVEFFDKLQRNWYWGWVDACSVGLKTLIIRLKIKVAGKFASSFAVKLHTMQCLRCYQRDQGKGAHFSGHLTSNTCISVWFTDKLI